MLNYEDIFQSSPPGFLERKPQDLAGSIQRQSDFYIENPGSPTPWSKDWCKEAQTSYYNILNSARMAQVFQRLDQVGFLEGISELHDFGSGLGATVHGLNNLRDIKMPLFLYEQADWPRQFLAKTFDCKTPVSRPKPFDKNGLLAASYSFNELKDLPKWISDFDHILIVEPATHQASRKLLGWRSDLIEKGYHVWAPCTHQGACPLLTESAKDWCHDGVRFEPPKNLELIYQRLPFASEYLTFCYLAVSKRAPVLEGAARITGDRRKEKGKLRQMVCFRSQREFLTGMKKNSSFNGCYRGELIQIPEFEEKSNELRITAQPELYDAHQSKPE